MLEPHARSRRATGRAPRGRSRFAPPGLLATAALASLVGCGDLGDEAGGGDFGAGGGSEAVGPGATTGGGEPPPEEELESNYTAPVATGRFVWIANPVSGRVAYIDARTLETRLVFAGNQPTFLAAVPDPVDDVALVLNVASRDATLLRADAVTSALTARSFEVPAAGNRWAISPDSRWALAWSDARAVEDADPIDGFQDISVLDLASGDARSVALTVGYRPVAVAFAEDSGRAFAVTQDGITVVGLDGEAPTVIENVPLSDDPLEDTLTRDVAITPDGELALVRRDGDATVTVHALRDGTRTDVVMPGPVTDMDLAADGSFAVLVVRETGFVAVLPIPAIAEAPEDYRSFTVDSTIVGSTALASDSATAFLYTNAIANPVLSVFDAAAAAPEARSILLRAPVAAVFPTANAAHAVVLHDAFEVEGGTRYPGALSLVPIADPFPPKIVGLEAPAIAIAIAPTGDRAIVATGDRSLGAYGFAVAQLPSLKVDTYALGSLPLAAGIVAGAGRGYVSQEHPDGRITFIDFGSGEVRTLTGFELAAQVVDGGAR